MHDWINETCLEQGLIVGIERCDGGAVMGGDRLDQSTRPQRNHRQDVHGVAEQEGKHGHGFGKVIGRFIRFSDLSAHQINLS